MKILPLQPPGLSELAVFRIVTTTNRNYLLVVIYNHSKSTPKSVFLKFFGDLLIILSSFDMDCFILGDFNINFFKSNNLSHPSRTANLETDPYATELIGLATSFSFFQVITTATRVTPTS